ncbi:TlpA family protein disulfide reductase [Pedobacter sp.]|uniref:TlpA family protein disulfide reductase n=1 Tax=Pedobacter sp. TaxID=1411316 RepID=UPI003D7FC5CF
MNALLTILLLHLFSLQAKSQINDIVKLAERIDEASKNISSAKYKLNTKYTKISVGEDSSTRVNLFDYSFKSNPKDTLLGYKFSSTDQSGIIQQYNGTDFYLLYKQVLEIAPAAKNRNKIKSLNQSDMYVPLFNSFNHRFQLAIKYNKLSSWKLSPSLVDYKGNSYYKITSPTYSKNDFSSYANYYISAKSFLPMGEEVIMENVIKNAKEIQTFNNWITELELNIKIDDKLFDKEILSGYNKERIVDEAQQPETKQLLKIGSLAPNWTLPLLDGGILKLSDLKDKIVIIDFWYKACAPCVQQMLDLQKLHDKFDKNKVVFIGVNTKDDPSSTNLTTFLKNRGITMKNVYNGKQIEKLYNVSASPALFIIDSNQQIAFSLDGYSTTLLNDLDREISKRL